jgi:FtsH-binding integral membrane protein
MAAALGLTAIVAYYISSNQTISDKLFKSSQSSIILICLLVAQVVLVIGISAAIRSISFTTALGLFFLYAGLLGVTLSSIFLVYEWGSIYQTFFIAAAMFGGMSLYGYFTNADLTSIGNIAIMIVWGLMISMLINMWFKSAQFDMITSMVGVIVFALLTAYDTQKIKRMGQQMLVDDETLSKIAVLGALTLYLDFINIFLFLLRFMGDRKK